MKLAPKDKTLRWAKYMYCSGQFSYASDPKGDHLVHSMPFCKEFEDMTPDAFVHEHYMAKVPNA